MVVIDDRIHLTFFYVELHNNIVFCGRIRMLSPLDAVMIISSDQFSYTIIRANYWIIK